MADGDLHMTVTVEGANVPLLVTSPKTGRAVDDTHGSGTRSRGNSANDTQGNDAQEFNGTVSVGKNGKVI